MAATMTSRVGYRDGGSDDYTLVGYTGMATSSDGYRDDGSDGGRDV